MKTITIHYTTPYIGTIAKQGEYNQTELVFYLPDSFNGADFVNAEFVKRDGSTSVVDQLIPNNGTVSFPLTQDLTNVDGKMEIQLVAYKADGTEITEIAKSGIYTCKIRKSLNVLYGEDKPGVIERILAFISYWSGKLPEILAKKHWHDNKALLDTITPEMLGGEQADWSENDATKKSFVKNRTHWKGTNTSYYDVAYEYDENEDQWNPVGETGTEGHAVPIVEGQEYVVTYKDQETTFVGEKFSGGDTTYIGNPDISYDEYVAGDFPFVLVYYDSNNQNNFAAIENLQSETVSFSILSETITYHPLPSEYLPSGVNDAVAKKHTHDNKTVLDNFSTAEAYPFTFLKHGGHTIPQFPINDVEPTTLSNDYTVPWLKPNVWNRFGSADSPVRSISILELEAVDNAVAEEYLVEFWTGENAPSPVIFPSDVEWPDGSEPLWQAEKHYQVSIVNNVGLWCESEEVNE